MDPSVGTSEIFESGEESNLGNHSNRTKPVRIKLREYEGKFHGFPIKNDFSRLLESVDLQKLPRILVASHQFAIEKLRDDAFKKPSRVGSLQESGFGNPEAVNLKQALRKLCISQASEQAAMRRTSKPAGLSCTSEAATISRLFASLIDEGNKADFSVVKGKRKVGVPIKRANIASNASQKTTQVCDLCSAELSSMKVVSSPQTVATASNATKVRMKDVIVQSKIASSMHIVASTSKTTKTRIQDVIATTPAKSMDHAWLSTEQRTKRNPNVIAYNPNTEMDTGQSKPCRSPRLTKPTFRSNLSFLKKGMQKSAASSRISDRFIEAEECVNSPTGANLVCRETVPPKPGTMLSSDTVGRKSINCVTDKCECDQNDSSSGKSTIARINKTSRSREKGDCSQSSVSSLGDYSSSTSFSSESYQSGSSYNAVRPHMSKDEKWVAVRHALNQHGNLCLMNFKLIRKLGCGDIGTVYLAELIGSGCLFALKVIDVELLLSRKKMLRAQCEREILQMLDHPFLPTLYAHFTEDNLSCLLMEYCPGGDLHVQRQKQPGRRFSESAARFYVAEVLLALEYLHMLGVIYRDLKPENILVREDGHIMLSDFDLSLRCTSSPTLIGSSSLDREEAPRKMSGPCSECSCINPYCLHPSMSQISCFTPRLLPSSTTKNCKIRSELVVEPTNARSNSFVGTHEYLAPEIIKGEGHGSSVDWWTFGIFLYELLYGRTPFKGPGNEETLINVVLQGLKFPETPTVSFHAMDLIKGLLVKDPESRLGSVKGAAEIKRHPFFDGLNWALIRCALPPEIPGSFKPGTPMSTSKEKEGECLEFGRNDDDIEIELF